MAEYAPLGNGKEKERKEVCFEEAVPPSHLCGLVHRYICLKTDVPLSQDFRFHALPDACSYIVFNQLDAGVAGASTLRNYSEEFNLGKQLSLIHI